jgi:hypothetical protein
MTSFTLLQNSLASIGSCLVVLGDESFFVYGTDNLIRSNVKVPYPALAQAVAEKSLLAVLTNKSFILYRFVDEFSSIPKLELQYMLARSVAQQSIAISRTKSESTYLVAVGGANGVFIYSVCLHDLEKTVSLQRHLLPHMPVCCVSLSEDCIACAIMDGQIFQFPLHIDSPQASVNPSVVKIIFSSIPNLKITTSHIHYHTIHLLHCFVEGLIDTVLTRD